MTALKKASPEQLRRALAFVYGEERTVFELLFGHKLPDEAAAARLKMNLDTFRQSKRAAVGSFMDAVARIRREDAKNTSGSCVEKLSPREREVLVLAASGLTDAEIARELSTSRGTAQNYVSGILAKLGVINRARLVVVAYESGLIRPGSWAEAPSVLAERVDKLAPREREVLVLVASGLTDAEIAGELSISQATAQNHVGRIRAKLDVVGRTRLVAVAYESGLIRPGWWAEAPSGLEQRVEKLAPREREVLVLVASGVTDADIADELSISKGRAPNHVVRIRTKLM